MSHWRLSLRSKRSHWNKFGLFPAGVMNKDSGEFSNTSIKIISVSPTGTSLSYVSASTGNVNVLGGTPSTATDSVVLGANAGSALGSSNGAICMGRFTNATADDSISIGTFASSDGNNDIIIGDGSSTSTTVDNVVLLGRTSDATQSGQFVLRTYIAGRNGTINFGALPIGAAIVIVNCPALTANSIILLSRQTTTDIPNIGPATITALNPGSNFHVTRTNLSDKSIIAWLVVN